jgi:hypothetical protein
MNFLERNSRHLFWKKDVLGFHSGAGAQPQANVPWQGRTSPLDIFLTHKMRRKQTPSQGNILFLGFGLSALPFYPNPCGSCPPGGRPPAVRTEVKLLEQLKHGCNISCASVSSSANGDNM